MQRLAANLDLIRRQWNLLQELNWQLDGQEAVRISLSCSHQSVAEVRGLLGSLLLFCENPESR